MSAGIRQLVVPTYIVNGGLDSKFQAEPREVPGLAMIQDKLSAPEYRRSIELVNWSLKKSRAGKASVLCLLSGPLMLPLIPYAAITYRNKRVRKRCLLKAIEEFNTQHPRLCMRWRRKPVSQLVIEDADPAEFQPIKHLQRQSGGGGEAKAESF